MIEFIFELIFTFIIEGIIEISKKLKTYAGLRILIGILGMIAFIVPLVFLMNKLGIW